MITKKEYRSCEWAKRFSVNGRTAAVIFILLIAASGAAAYVNSLNGEFLWDDEVLVQGNVYIKSFSSLPKIFSQDIGGGAARKYGYYRPFQMITYMMDYSLWRLDVRGYHLTNILLHVLAAITLYWWINLTFSDRLLSFFAGILFAVHPVHTEAVAYISGRSDSLALLFMLLCFVFYQKALDRQNSSYPVLILLTWAAALLSRESSLILLPLLLLYHYTFKKPFSRRLFLPLLGIALVYAVFRLTALRHLLPHTTSSTTLFQRLPGFFAALYGYLRILVLPLHLHMEYGNKLFNFADPGVIAGAALLLFLAAVTFRRRDDKLVFFSVSWLLLTLLPVSNLYPLNAYMAEHWLYLPSVGVFLLTAGIFSQFYRSEKFRIITAVLITGLILLYFTLTVRQNRYWRERAGFYERTLKYSPESPRIFNNLGLVYNSSGRNEEAIEMYQKALSIKPRYFEVYNNLGSAYRALGKKEEAIASYQRALELKPGYPEAHYNLGTVYSSLGRRDEAASLFIKTIELNPNYAGAYNDLAVVYTLTGRHEQAIELFSRAIAVNPDFAGAYNNLGNVLYQTGRKEEALAMYRKAVTIQPVFAEAYFNLGRIYDSLGNKEKAIASFRRAVEIRPDYAPAHQKLAVIYYRNKQYDLALTHCDRAMEMGSGFPPEFLKFLEPHR